jgi:hypothetical protein
VLANVHIFQSYAGRGLRKSLHCACGHVVAFHDSRGCGGLTLRDGPCACGTSDVAALDAGIKSFVGSHARLRRYVLRFPAHVSVRRGGSRA